MSLSWHCDTFTSSDPDSPINSGYSRHSQSSLRWSFGRSTHYCSDYFQAANEREYLMTTLVIMKDHEENDDVTQFVTPYRIPLNRSTSFRPYLPSLWFDYLGRSESRPTVFISPLLLVLCMPLIGALFLGVCSRTSGPSKLPGLRCNLRHFASTESS